MSYVPGLICSNCDCLTVEIDQVRRERDEAKDILRELVRLKTLHDKIESYKYRLDTNPYDGWREDEEEYARCKPIAWDRARAIVETKP